MVWCGARNGRRVTSGQPGSSSPATEWMRVTSIASSSASGGRMPGSRRASIVLPPPGGPSMSIEWPPAAATSSARRAAPCPRTSARSGPRAPSPLARRAWASSRTGDGSVRPSRRSTAARRVAGPRISTPRTSVASAALPRGTTSRRHPWRAACSAIASAPGTGRSDPSSASSPTAPAPTSEAGATWPDAHRMASASGRSYCGPALRRSAGARFATIRRAGTWNAWLARPERTRSRASCTAASGRPTTEKAGRPARRSTSTSTVEVSRPRTAGLTSRATTRPKAPRGVRADEHPIAPGRRRVTNGAGHAPRLSYRVAREEDAVTLDEGTRRDVSGTYAGSPACPCASRATASTRSRCSWRPSSPA